MAGFTPCAGSGRNAVKLRKNKPVGGLGFSTVPARTYGECPVCGRAIAERGHVNRIKVARHKAK